MVKCLTALLFVFALAANSAQTPLENFTKHGDYLNMKLSPDGKHISARVRMEGRVFLVIMDASTMKVVGGVRPRDGDEIHSAQWINNNRIVYQFQESVYYIDHPVATGELFAIDIDGSNSDILYGYRAGENSMGSNIKKREDTRATPQIISLLPDDDKHILIAEYPWRLEGRFYYDDRKKPSIVTKLNVYSGKKRKITTIPYPGARPFATDDGEVKFVRWVDNDTGYYQAAYRENEDSEWKNLTDKLDDSYVPISLNADGSKLYLSGDAGEEEFTSYFEFDLKTEKLTQLFSGMKADIAGLNWDPELEKPVVGISYPDKHQYFYAPGESKTKKLHKMLASAFEGQDVYITSQSKDGGLLLLHVSSDVNPGEYYLFDTKTNGASFVWANRSWLDPRTLASKQPIKFKTSDDLDINGYLTIPIGHTDDVKAPLVVMIHGGPHQGRDYWDFNGEVQLLANRGYAVLQVNFRGSPGYGDVFETAGYREWGGKMIQDIIEGTQYTVDNFAIDQDRICTYGGSYGGYAALMSTVRAPDMFKCTIGYVGIYDLNYAFTESDTMKSMGGAAYLNRVLGKNKTILNEFSPVNHADKIKANVMLIHGDKDSRVPVINAETMLKRLKEQGKEVPYLNFNRSGHGVWDEEGRVALYQGMLDFLEENIGK